MVAWAVVPAVEGLRSLSWARVSVAVTGLTGV